MAFDLPYVQVKAAGAIRNLKGKPQFDLEGALNPDWDAITALLALKVEPNARITGQSRPWRISGSLDSAKFDEVLQSLHGELGIQIDELDIFGMRLGHSALVVRAGNGKIQLDPIDATLNHGALHLDPELVLDDNGHRWIRTGPILVAWRERLSTMR